MNQENKISLFSLGIENRFKVYVHEYITKDDDKNEDKTISIEKESEQKILPDDNQCSNGIT
jgi:hypothetical protein